MANELKPDRVRAAIERAAARALFREGEAIMAKSKQIVPVDKGALRASGHTQLPVIEPGSVSVTLAYGGAAAPYAVFVHEDLTKRHAPPTQAKFLEQPLKEAATGFAERIGAAISAELARA